MYDRWLGYDAKAMDRRITGNWGADNCPEAELRRRGLSEERIAEIMDGGPARNDDRPTHAPDHPDYVPF